MEFHLSLDRCILVGTLDHIHNTWIWSAWASSTNWTYARQWDHSTLFCERVGLSPLLVEQRIIELFLCSLLASFQGASVNKAKSAIAQAHQMSGFVDPTSGETTKLLTRAIYRLWGEHDRIPYERHP